MMFAFLAPLLLRFSGISNVCKGFVAKIPPKGWEALAVLGYALALYLTHQGLVHRHDAAIIAANNAQWSAKLNAAAAQVAKKDAELAADATQLRKANDEENSRIAADANDLRLHGAGKAACPRVPGIPAAPGRPQPAGRPADAAGPQVPADEFAAVPWDWLVGRAEEHDVDRAEVLSWREWYQKMVAAWPKATAR